MNLSLHTFPVIFLAAVSALALGPLGIWSARRLKLLDLPRSQPHKKHPSPRPFVGGTIVLLSVGAVGAIEGSLLLPGVWVLVLPGVVVFAFGLWDDIRALPVLAKLLGQVLATLLLIGLGVQVRLFDAQWLNLALTLLWMLGVTNAYNFVDSMDGLATGLAGLAAAFFMLVAFDSGQRDLSSLAALFLGACSGLYYYTSRPARLFLGDSGAQFLGFTMAGLAIAYNPPGLAPTQSWFVPILLVGVPIFDVVLVVASRLRRGKPIYQAGLDHTYHRLVALGLDPAHAVLVMHLCALLLGCVAFIAMSLPFLPANLLFAGILLVGAAGLFLLERRTRAR